MARRRAEDLLRKPDQPPRATFKDLLFDLVFVLAFAGITELLVADATVHRQTFFREAGKTLLLLLALLMVWFVTAWVTDLYAGQGLVIEHPLGRTDPIWLTLILGGPALFIVGRASFERTVFGSRSRHWVIGLLLLVVPVPVMRFVPPLAVAATAMAALLWLAVADAAGSRRHPADRPSPSAGTPS